MPQQRECKLYTRIAREHPPPAYVPATSLKRSLSTKNKKVGHLSVPNQFAIQDQILSYFFIATESNSQPCPSIGLRK